MKIASILLFMMSLASSAAAGHLHPERYYQERWCNEIGGQMEVVLDDGTRVDCLTDEYAVEVDFAKKWAEGIGQALYYAEKTGRRPGVLLIMENDKDARYLDRLDVVADEYLIQVWTTGGD